MSDGNRTSSGNANDPIKIESDDEAGPDLGNSILSHRPGVMSQSRRRRRSGSDESSRRDEREVRPKLEPDEDAHINPPRPSGLPASAVTAEQLEALPVGVLDAKQRRIIQLAVHERKPMFATGPGGSGKSTVLQVLKQEFRKEARRFRCLAPTGTAAVNIKGQTIHSGASLGMEQKKGLQWYVAHGKKAHVKERFRNLDVLIIDEISMVSKELLERLNAVVTAARASDKPFGGLQVIFFGDFRQLPPVNAFENCIDCGHKRKPNDHGTEYTCPAHGAVFDADKWAFKSPLWRALGFSNVLLRQPYRQVDPGFLDILDQIWIGRPLTADQAARLKNHTRPVNNAVALFARKEKAKEYNDEQFAKLPGRALEYRCADDFHWESEVHPELKMLNERSFDEKTGHQTVKYLKDHRYQDIIRLKKNMPIILTTNIDVDRGLINGSQGEIIDFVEYDPASLPRPRTSITEALYDPETFDSAQDSKKKFGYYKGNLSSLRYEEAKQFMRRNPTLLPLVKFPNVDEPVIVYPHCSISEHGFETPYSLMLRTQLPLLPSWAITIHRSQGMTLDRVKIHLADFWLPELLYVAMSRGRHWENVQIVDTWDVHIGGSRNPEVLRFLRDTFDELREEIGEIG